MKKIKTTDGSYVVKIYDKKIQLILEGWKTRVTPMNFLTKILFGFLDFEVDFYKELPLGQCLPKVGGKKK